MENQQRIEEFEAQPRLPKFASPKSYDIFLKPDLSTCQFTGSVAIALDVLSPTRFLVLNSAELVIDKDSVLLQSDQEIRPCNITLVEKDEILVLEFDSVLPIGEAVLKMGFTGTLNDQLKGFYRGKCEYKGEMVNMAMTQFQSVDARRCFPCWDEPAFKAKFKISLEVPNELVALSNMPVSLEKVINEGLKTLYFEESPLMSTYLVALVVGHLDYVESQTQDGVKVRVYTQVGKSEQGKFALDVGIKSLDLYKDYFGVAYPLPKLDMVAAPDFASGAMENYGLVTYREIVLLYDPLLSSAFDKQRVAVTVAHELAHQWFGNLVTMEWWTHLWLNEGFATWVSYLVVDKIFPNWNTWTQFLDETSNGMRLDALSESHPIEVEVKHANEADSIFDSISYEKGSYVIHMLHSYLGPDRFQKALAAYIKKYAYSNAKTEDLWAVLEEESGEPVKDLMSSWTKQQGYPVIYANLNATELQINQEQFLLEGSSGTGTWIVPVTLSCSSNETKKKFILKSKSDKLDLSDIISNENDMKNETFWIKLNAEQTGFYRVKYDNQLAAGLRYAIKTNKLPLTDKYGIIGDAYALSVACKESVSSLLTLLNAYAGESDFTVIAQIITVGLNVAKMVVDATPDFSENINLFFINLLLSQAERLGWDAKEGESHLDAMLRTDLIMSLVRFGHKNTINEGIKRFNIFINDPSSSVLSPDNRDAAYLSVMQTVTASNKSGYESLLKIFRETTESQEKESVLRVLADCPDKSIVLDSLNFLLTDEVRKQDAAFGIIASTEGRETAWQWLKDNWEYISKTWTSTTLISNFVHSVICRFNSYEKAEEIEEFFASRTKPTFERCLKQNLERIRINARWAQSVRNEKSLSDVVSNLIHNE